MDLARRLLDLVAPLRIGDDLGGGARLTGASAELGLRLSFEVGGQAIHIELSPAEERRPFAARTSRLHLAYRTSSQAPVDAARAHALCVQLATLAAPNEDAVLADLAAAAAAAAIPDRADARIREVRVERLLEPAEAAGRRFYTLSPYVGCVIGCRFCYAQSRLASVRRLERLPEVAWGSYVDVRVNAAEVLAAELAARAPAPIKFCPIVSDPYQAVETRYRITRACLTTIRDTRWPAPTFVLTRSRLIEQDTALLAAIPGLHAGASIPTADDEVRRHFEPRASSIAERRDALRALRAAGVRTFAVVQPMLPGPVEALAELLAETVTSVSLDVLGSLEGAAADFADPRWAHARDEAWQRTRLAELSAALIARGVIVWAGELPP